VSATVALPEVRLLFNVMVVVSAVKEMLPLAVPDVVEAVVETLPLTAIEFPVAVKLFMFVRLFEMVSIPVSAPPKVTSALFRLVIVPTNVRSALLVVVMYVSQVVADEV